MSAYEVTDALLSLIGDDRYDVIILNFANADMVGHTGNFSAAVQAVEAVDQCLEKIVETILEKEGMVLITADHGNAEYMAIAEGAPYTAHTTNKVPFMFVNIEDKKLVSDQTPVLADIAPTMLDILGIPKPSDMTGMSLIAK